MKPEEKITSQVRPTCLRKQEPVFNLIFDSAACQVLPGTSEEVGKTFI